MANFSLSSRRRFGATVAATTVGCTTVSFIWWWMKRRERASAAILRHLLWDNDQDKQQRAEARMHNIGEDPGRGDEDGWDTNAGNSIVGTCSGFSEFIAMLFPAIYFGKNWAKTTKSLRRSASRQKLHDATRIERKSNSDLAALGRDPPAIRPSICFQGSGCVIVVSLHVCCWSGPSHPIHPRACSYSAAFRLLLLSTPTKYHVGVARYLQEHFYLDESEGVTFLAASGGSIVAAMLALNMPMEVAMHENLRLATLSRRLPFGPFGRILDDVAGAFEALLQHWTDDDVRRVTRGDSNTAGGSALPEPGSGELAVQRRAIRNLPLGRDLKQPPPLAPPPPRKTQNSPTATKSPLPAPRLILSLTHGSTLSPRLMRHFPTKVIIRLI